MLLQSSEDLLVMCSSIFSLASPTSDFTSIVSSFIQEITTSLTISLIVVSSISSTRKARARMAFVACLETFAIPAIWCRHVDRDKLVTGSPAGQRSSRISRNFLPSVASHMSSCSSTMVLVPVFLVSFLVACLLVLVVAGLVGLVGLFFVFCLPSWDVLLLFNISLFICLGLSVKRLHYSTCHS